MLNPSNSVNFNTASVPIQHGSLYGGRVVFSISIQLLFLFNDLRQAFTSMQGDFNTASVPIQRKPLIAVHVLGTISIQLLFLFNPANTKHGNSKGKISIQLLFLFNRILRFRKHRSTHFNTASVPIQPFLQSRTHPYIGHFNTASVPIQPWVNRVREAFPLFQYSFCSYSTFSKIQAGCSWDNFNTASVPIQRGMSRRILHGRLNFNTASVPIQQQF